METGENLYTNNINKNDSGKKKKKQQQFATATTIKKLNTEGNSRSNSNQNSNRAKHSSTVVGFDLPKNCKELTGHNILDASWSLAYVHYSRSRTARDHSD
jgi:hypothetical protein